MIIISFHYHLRGVEHTDHTIKSSEVRNHMDGTRRVGVAVDFSVCSKKALQWAVDNIVRNGDHLILVTVVPEGGLEKGEQQLWEASGSRMLSSF